MSITAQEKRIRDMIQSRKAMIPNATRIATLNPRGHEVVDSTPVAVPLGFKRPPSIAEQMQMYIRSELSRHFAQKEQKETFEEADDFDVDDDLDNWESPYEDEFDPVEFPPRKPPQEAETNSPVLNEETPQPSAAVTPVKPAP